MSLAAVHTPLSSCFPEGKDSGSAGITTSGTYSPAADVEDMTWLALAGINSSESSQKSGKNEHFRVFSVSTRAPSGSASISLLSKNELFSPTADDESYQRLLHTKGSFAAIASGGGSVGSEIVVVGVPELDLKRRIRLPGKDEATDLGLSDEGLLAYCTTKDIFVTSTNEKDGDEPRKLVWQSTLPPKGSLRSIRFCGSQKNIIAVLNHPQRTGSELLLINAIGGGKLLTRKNLHKSIGAATGMDVVSLGLHQEIVAVAGADRSVEILVVESDKIITVKTFRNVHPFQITRVSFSPVPKFSPYSKKGSNAIRLATTSMGNTVVIFTLPLISGGSGYWSLLRGISVAKQTVISVLLSLVGVVTFAVMLQLVFEARAGLPLPIERNAIMSRFNEVLGAKTSGAAAKREPYMIIKEVWNDDGEEVVPHTAAAGGVAEAFVQDVD